VVVVAPLRAGLVERLRDSIQTTSCREISAEDQRPAARHKPYALPGARIGFDVRLWPTRARYGIRKRRALVEGGGTAEIEEPLADGSTRSPRKHWRERP
jgi:hypothetical protein